MSNGKRAAGARSGTDTTTLILPMGVCGNDQVSSAAGSTAAGALPVGTGSTDGRATGAGDGGRRPSQPRASPEAAPSPALKSPRRETPSRLERILLSPQRAEHACRIRRVAELFAIARAD